ncbi:atherin-like [Mustela erminea]|uniref:atherin-like n=1 Tax=Mustela erminea TaxID=36723 RepID=UPI001386F009|nr:atherin-like [Mustela erminea]
MGTQRDPGLGTLLSPVPAAQSLRPTAPSFRNARAQPAHRSAVLPRPPTASHRLPCLLVLSTAPPPPANSQPPPIPAHPQPQPPACLLLGSPSAGSSPRPSLHAALRKHTSKPGGKHACYGARRQLLGPAGPPGLTGAAGQGLPHPSDFQRGPDPEAPHRLSHRLHQHGVKKPFENPEKLSELSREAGGPEGSQTPQSTSPAAAE